MNINADRSELAKFNWWDPRGAFRPLHEMNPLRLAYIESAAALAGKRVLDVGCGGGILSESMARAGASVTGIDLASDALEIAKLHALESGTRVDYRLISAEALLESGAEPFDTVTCMEMLEHVPDPAATLSALRRLTHPGGQIFVSTLNRNLKSFALAILGAEYLLGLLPRGTHEYSKFIKPSELARWGRECGLAMIDIKGVSYNPLNRSFALGGDVGVNYLAQLRPRAN
jgi:2-polyprenyl-6-hydroxyphenyl methylase/3-demethylubiquinone-9 3-methyltransferase